MKKPIMAICDSDKVYAERLHEYLLSHLNLSFDIHSFTDFGIMDSFAKNNLISLLLISGKETGRLLSGTESISDYRNVIVLDEDGAESVLCEESGSYGKRHIEHISKYQPAHRLADSIIDFCVRDSEGLAGIAGRTGTNTCRIIGFYSPVSGSRQTELAIGMAGQLAADKRTLFLSLESYSSLVDSLGIEEGCDIMDLLYYAECERDKFGLYLEKIKVTRNGLDYIAPPGTAMQLKEINAKKLRDLLSLLETETGYERIVMDLSEYPDDFYDILQMCDELYMPVNKDSGDLRKVSRFIEALNENGYCDVAAGIKRCEWGGQRIGA